MTRNRKPRRVDPVRSSVGGAGNEIGAHLRASVAAWIAAHGLAGRPLRLISPTSSAGIPWAVCLETAEPFDDVGVTFTDGARAQIQTKYSVTLGAKSKPMQAAVGQWRTALAAGAADPRYISLVLVTANPSAGIRSLRVALERAKDSHSGPPSSAERDALASFRAMLSVSRVEFETLLKLASILDVRADPNVADLGQFSVEMLDGRVVAQGEGARAWPALVDYAQELARRRAGASIPEWIDALRRRGLALLADAQLGVSAQLEAERLAVERYRERLIHDAGLLDLRGLGVPYAPFPLPIDVARIRVHGLDEGPGSGYGQSITAAFRRRGRSLLTGPPGAGKSTALIQAAAAWARQPEWPLPVVLRIPELWRASLGMPPFAAILNASIRDVPADDQNLLRSALERRIKDGTVALFFDALDETRESRLRVVRLLDRLIQHELAEVAEIVLSTRDIAYADAATLGFKPLKLAPPVDVKAQVRGVLSGLAPQLVPNPALRADWIRDRAIWVERVLRRDESLAQTPLMPLLLTLLAVEDRCEPAPLARADILAHVVENTVRRWEVRQRRIDVVRIGTLEGELATTALLESFELIGWLLTRDEALGKKSTESALAESFRERWGLAPAAALVAAKEALLFWDESGVYVFSGHEETVSARVTLLAETGAARHLVSLDRSTQRTRIEQLAGKTAARTTLSLAMSHDPTVTADVVQLVVAGRDIDALSWCAREVGRGASISGEDLGDLVRALLDHHTAARSEAWQITKILCGLAVPAPLMENVQSYLSLHLNPTQRIIAEAMLSSSAGRPPDGLDRVLAAIAAEVRPSGRLAALDRDVEAFAVSLAERVLCAQPKCAEGFAAIAAKVGVNTAVRLGELLAEVGRQDLEPKAFGDMATLIPAPLRHRDVLHDLSSRLLKEVSRFGVPGSLSLVQRRRLDELADYIASLTYGDASPGEIWDAFEHESRLPWLLRTVAVLGSFDLSVLAAEAQVALSMENAMAFLFDAASAAQPSHWELIKDQRHAVTMLSELVGSPRWGCDLAVAALEHTPLGGDAATLMEPKLPAYAPYQRLQVAWLINELRPAESSSRLARWKENDDPILRRVAANAIAETKPPSESAWALSDPDGGVRESAIDAIHKRPDAPAFGEMLRRQTVVARPVGWKCLWCGADNAAAEGRHGCRQCHLSGPDPVRAAQEVLNEIDARGESGVSA